MSEKFYVISCFINLIMIKLNKNNIKKKINYNHPNIINY